MPTRGPYYVDKDAWVAQLVGGTTQYGNGQGTLVHVGPVPQAGGGPDFKSRGMFEFSASDMAAFFLDGTAVANAYIDVYVGDNTCLGSRGANTYLFLEEMTADFSEKAVSGCVLSSGTGLGVWGQSNNAVTANRATFSGTSLALNAQVRFDVSALMAARLAASNFGAFRFRIIAANATLDDYDEEAPGRRLSVYSREYVTDVTKRPQLSGSITIGSVAKAMADTGHGTETFSIAQSSTSPSFADFGIGTDTFSVAIAATWSTGLDESDNGRALLYLPAANVESYQLLPASIGDIQLRARCELDKVPLGGSASFYLLARAIDPNNCYRARMVMGGTLHDIALEIEKVVGGVVTVLQYITNVRAFLAATDYWLKLQVEDNGAGGTTLNAKLWRWGELEPGWALQIEDTEASLQADGMTGMGGKLSSTVTNAPITMSIDQFEGYAP